MVSGDRILQAREICGLTQEQLARAVHVEQPFISFVERGLRDPSNGVVEAIAFKTGFSPAFFRRGPGPEFPAGTLLFRRRKTATSQDLARIRQLARLAFELSESFAKRFKPLPLQFPQLSESPDVAARMTRAALGLSPESPIPHLVNRLERAGIVILPVPFELEEHDAFSVWADTEPRKPVIVFSTGKPGDRQRFSISHELGHLVLHRAPQGSASELEQEANRFAGEFLLPEEAIRRELELPLTLSGLAEAKARWGVSMQAIVTRALDLRLIDDDQRINWMKRFSAKGWRKKEPIPIEPEKPRLLAKMAEETFGVPPDPAKVAAEINCSTAFAAELLGLFSLKEAHSGSVDVSRATKPEVDEASVVPLLRFPGGPGRAGKRPNARRH